MIRDLKGVVITGMGVITPIENSLDEFWNNLVAGKSGVITITKFDTTHFKTKFAAVVKNVEPNKCFERNKVRKYALFTQYAIAASDKAIIHAGIDFNFVNYVP
jgi:3-oxoacyl-[acyl-carrier-protein] synthase II